MSAGSVTGYPNGSGDWHCPSWPSVLPALRLGKSWPGTVGMAAWSWVLRAGGFPSTEDEQVAREGCPPGGSMPSWH